MCSFQFLYLSGVAKSTEKRRKEEKTMDIMSSIMEFNRYEIND